MFDTSPLSGHLAEVSSNNIFGTIVLLIGLENIFQEITPLAVLFLISGMWIVGQTLWLTW